MPVPDIYTALKNAVLRMGANCNVTRRALSLGSQDSVTGWYAKSYAETTIEMLVIPKAMQAQFVGMGIHVRYDAVGVTRDTVAVGDQVYVTGSTSYYTVMTVDSYYLGDQFVYRESQLAHLPFL